MNTGYRYWYNSVGPFRNIFLEPMICASTEILDTVWKWKQVTASKKRVITAVGIRFQRIAVGYLNSCGMSTASKRIVAVADDNKIFALARIILFMKHSRLHD